MNRPKKTGKDPVSNDARALTAPAYRHPGGPLREIASRPSSSSRTVNRRVSTRGAQADRELGDAGRKQRAIYLVRIGALRHRAS